MRSITSLVCISKVLLLVSDSAPSGCPMAFHRHLAIQQSKSSCLSVALFFFFKKNRILSERDVAIPNLYSVQTLNSIKAANILNKALSGDRPPLRVLIQVNTSGEDAKSGLPALTVSSNPEESELVSLAKHVVSECPRLHLEGLMTIGSLELSLAASGTDENSDFEKLKETRDLLATYLEESFEEKRWGDPSGRLLLSMGMSSDFEAALKSGSDIVRVGTGIFGQRQTKS